MSLRAPLKSARTLCEHWDALDARDDARWPARQWRALCDAGVTRWTIPAEFGGEDQPADALMEGCLELARAELLTTFVLSQFQAACSRIAAAPNPLLKQRWLPALAAGMKFATVGISHLTTSRQHTAPAVAAIAHGDGYRLRGVVPWVTGSRHADVVVLGGTLPDGNQILAAVPTDRPGVRPSEPMPLLALTGSETGPIGLHDVEVRPDELIAGPTDNVIQKVGSGGAGSLMTSTLALGHAFGCLDQLTPQAAARSSLAPVLTALRSEAEALRDDLLPAAREGAVGDRSPEILRSHATDLALRCSQALLTATKGAGFVAGHPAERLCREALFFLVWSCPQAVATRLLQNFSGCESGIG